VKGASSTSPETGRTPRSEAGCNKPAALEQEKAVEVVRNDADGTCEASGMASPKGWKWETADILGVDCTKGDDGGENFGIPREEGSRTRRSTRSTSGHVQATGGCPRELEIAFQQPQVHSEQSENTCGVTGGDGNVAGDRPQRPKRSGEGDGVDHEGQAREGRRQRRVHRDHRDTGGSWTSESEEVPRWEDRGGWWQRPSEPRPARRRAEAVS